MLSFITCNSCTKRSVTSFCPHRWRSMDRLTACSPSNKSGGSGRKGEKKHLLLLQRTQVWILAPTVSLKLSGAIALGLGDPTDIWPPKVPAHMVHFRGWQDGPRVKRLLCKPCDLRPIPEKPVEWDAETQTNLSFGPPHLETKFKSPRSLCFDNWTISLTCYCFL